MLILMAQVFIAMGIASLIVEHGCNGNWITVIWGVILVTLLFTCLPLFIVLSVVTIILSTSQQ